MWSRPRSLSLSVRRRRQHCLPKRRTQRAVAPVGGGTALNLGNPPERVDAVLSTERLAGIIDYEPTDLVLSVGAGARFGDVQAVLAEHGQRLPLDPPGGETRPSAV